MDLKWIVFLIAVLFSGCSSEDKNVVNAPEKGQVTLFDKDTKAIAYIDYGDDSTIYLFKGKPVAYLVSESEVFGFNGKFLGWYKNNVLYDLDGYTVGAEQGIARGSVNTIVTHLEELKTVPSIKPVKHVRQVLPVQRLLLDQWSKITLADFLTGGISE